MADQGLHMIGRMQKAWTSRLLLACVLMTIAVAVSAGAVMTRFFHASLLWLPAIVIFAAIASYAILFVRISEKDVSCYLDKWFPLAEESTALLLKPSSDLNFFEKRQVEKVVQQLEGGIALPPGILKKMKISVGALISAVLLAIVFYLVPPDPFPKEQSQVADQKPVMIEKILPGISGVTVTITPPANTGMLARGQDKFNIQAEEGSNVQWKIKTNLPAAEIQLRFNDSSLLRLTPSADSTLWTSSRKLRSPGFYQVKMGDSLSEFYRIDMIPDQLPEITVRTPEPNSIIEPGMAYRTLVDVSVKDDYGLNATSLFATIATGSGESVAFREQRLPFSNFIPGRRSIDLKKQIDLLQLKMAPGDELYFYISAVDNNNKEKRSDVYIVRIEDTTELMSLEGLASGIDIKPEFFRSQRQIIIETEQLLKDQATISKEAFASKSNDLGIDQRLLRLRYGKFLGEETDAEIGGEDHHEAGHDEGDVGDMMDRYTHKHDNAEDATFFDPDTKKQLKATLAEMWKAELQLRTIKPRDALPFEYRALRLLKDLQQKTRAYVSKTGIKTTPLDPKKRLSAELTGIQQVSSTRKITSAEEKLTVARKTLGILAQLHDGTTLSAEDKQMMRDVLGPLSEKASKDPSVYVGALSAMNRIINNDFSAEDIRNAANGLMKMLGPSKLLPAKAKAGDNRNLSTPYFKKIASVND